MMFNGGCYDTEYAYIIQKQKLRQIHAITDNLMAMVNDFEETTSNLISLNREVRAINEYLKKEDERNE